MFRADFVIEYPATITPSWSALPTLPQVLEMCRIFFAPPFSRNGSATCETSAGPTLLVLNVSRRISGSIVNAVSRGA